MIAFKSIIHNNFGYILCAIAICIVISCKSDGNKSLNENQDVSGDETTVKPPQTDLHSAVLFGNLDAVNQHIQAKSDLNKKDDYGSTPLNVAVTFGKTAIAKALINGGADLHTTNTEGSTPLHVASFFCRTDIVKALLEKGADKSLTNNYGSTALMSVVAPFDEVKPIYEQINKDLGPLGLKLDYDHIEQTRPVIAELLK